LFRTSVRSKKQRQKFSEQEIERIESLLKESRPLGDDDGIFFDARKKNGLIYAR